MRRTETRDRKEEIGRKYKEKKRNGKRKERREKEEE